MARFRRLKRSIRCHLKHGARCPHIERHTMQRPRRRKKVEASPPPPPVPGIGRHTAPGS